MALSKEELGNIRHETQKDSNIEKKTIEKPKSNKKILIISIVSVVFLLIFGGIGFSYVNSIKLGPLDGFAQCLTEKGAVMYGASWCQYTHGQKAMFGNSIRFIDYRDFSENKEVKITPTWFFNGEKYENAQSIDKLSSITGCTI
jgi:flagellar basal body-associated protein FliL|tara:strand:- start:1224 stop:1655 length:432 start_codon:yes stop_codon:yes gene_type:complete